jgi:hypothetical protein
MRVIIFKVEKNMGKSRWPFEAIFENSRWRTNVNETTSNLWEGFLSKSKSKSERKNIVIFFKKKLLCR